MNGPYPIDTENELLRMAAENPGKALALQPDGSVTVAPEVAEIVGISAVFGRLPGMVEVSVRNDASYRVSLDWDDVDSDGRTVAPNAHLKIEESVKAQGGFDAVEWKL